MSEIKEAPTPALSISQSLAIQEDCPDITLIAGPGSGKTRTLTARVARLLSEKKADPAGIAIMTFTVSAAREFRERLVALGVSAAEIDRFRHFGTLHGFARKLIRESGLQFRTLPEGELRELIRATQARLRMNYPNKKVSESLTSTSYQPGNLGMLASKIRREMKLRGALSYDVQLTEAHRVLVEGTASARVQFLFVDECQDTSRMDAAIYRAIEAESKFFVGDPDQSIFEFRGASPYYLIEAAEHSRTITLEENYRCAPAICEFADRIIGPAQVFLKRTISMNGAPGRVGVETYETEEEELLAIAEWAKEQPGSCAVLCRYTCTAKRVAEVLRGKGLSVSTPSDPEPDLEFDEALAGIESGMMPESAGPNAQAALDDLLNGPMGTSLVAQFLSRFTDDLSKLQRAREALEGGIRPSELAEYFASTSMSGEGISVMTIHAAKGREWDHVWIPAVNILAFYDNAEDRRLLFVAVTRARNEVQLSAAGTCSMPGESKTVGVGHLRLSPLLDPESGSCSLEETHQR